MSKLARYCTGLIEAACLAVVALVPVFLNPFSTGNTEADKQVLILGSTLLVIAAWLVFVAERPLASHPRAGGFAAPLLKNLPDR